MSERIKVARVAEMIGLSPREVMALGRRIPSAIQFAPRTWTYREDAVREWLPHFRAAGGASVLMEEEKPGPFGLIYAIQGPPGTPVKIGFSTPRALQRRLASLQTGNPYQLRILCHAQGYLRDERKAHAVLEADGLVGEWFAWSERTRRFVDAMSGGIDAALTAAKT